MKTILPTWLGSFYGSSFTFEEYEVRTINNFYTLCGTQSNCLENRWFDYARLHPLQATYYFVECYRRISNQFAKKYFALETSGVKYQDFLDSRERNSFWNMRSFCDINGYSYPWFIYSVMEYLLESGKFKNRLPRPQHLLSDIDEGIVALKQCWNAHIGGDVLVTSFDPYFYVSNWEGSSVQQKYEDFLVKQINSRPVKRFVLATLLYQKQHLRFERGLQEFPDYMDEAMSVSFNFGDS